MTKTTFPCPRCKYVGLEVLPDHIYCPGCKRRFKLPVLPREVEVLRKAGSITFDFGDGREEKEDIYVPDKVSTMGDEWR